MNRRIGIAVFGLSVLLLGAVPWSFRITAPAVAHTERQQAVFAPFASQIMTVQAEGVVSAGMPLATFDAPDLRARGLRTAANVQALNRRIAGLEAEDSGIDQRRTTDERLGEQMAESIATKEEGDRLRVSAEFDGVWLDVEPTLQAGTWVGTRNQIGVLVDPKKWIVDAYVEQRQINGIQIGAKATFRPERQWRSVDAEVVDVDSTRSSKLSQIMLDARHGGSIATQAAERAVIPVEALYRVRLALSAPLPDRHETRGRVAIDGPRKSLAWELIKRLAGLAIRESGF